MTSRDDVGRWRHKMLYFIQGRVTTQYGSCLTFWRDFGKLPISLSNWGFLYVSTPLSDELGSALFDEKLDNLYILYLTWHRMGISASVISLVCAESRIRGVANGEIETLQDGETSVFLCETETFEISEMRDRDFRVYKLRDRDFLSNTTGDLIVV